MSTAQHTAPTILDLPIGLADTGHRKEFDSLGEVMVPADRYWAPKRSARWSISISAMTACRRRSTTPTAS